MSALAEPRQLLDRLPGRPRLVLAAPPLSTEWHEARRLGLGGSDVAAALGFDDWRCPYEVWAAKRGLTPANEDSEPAAWGRLLEPVVATWAAGRLDAQIVDPPGVLAHAEHPWALGNVDRLLQMSDGTDAVLECKVTSHADGWKGDDLPARAEVQARWYLAITGLPVAYVAAVLNGRQGVIRRVDRDPVIEDWLLESARRFWQRVEDNDPPPPGPSPRVTQLLNAVESIEDAVIDLGPEWDRHLRSLGQLRRLQENTEAAIREHENALRAAMGEHERACIDGREVATYRTQTARRIDTKRLAVELPDVAEAYRTASTSRPLRVKLAEEESA